MSECPYTFRGGPGEGDMTAAIIAAIAATFGFRELQIAFSSLYQIDAGHAAAKLDELVPRDLSKVPLDPASDEPYKVRSIRLVEKSRVTFPAFGEEPKAVQLLPGQGVLWLGEGDARTWNTISPAKSQ